MNDPVHVGDASEDWTTSRLPVPECPRRTVHRPDKASPLASAREEVAPERDDLEEGSVELEFPPKELA